MKTLQKLTLIGWMAGLVPFAAQAGIADSSKDRPNVLKSKTTVTCGLLVKQKEGASCCSGASSGCSGMSH